MRECTGSYVVYRHDERITACVIVNRDSNEKQDDESSWRNNVIDVLTPALHTTPRVMTMLRLESRSARLHGWVIARIPTSFLTSSLVCLNLL